MYVQSKQGFLEVDEYMPGEGEDLPIGHLAAISEAEYAEPDCTVVVVRSRERVTLEFGTSHLKRELVIFTTPSWDYEFRVYLALSEWIAMLAMFAADIDYRNFKSWCKKNSTPIHAALAHGIWHEATILSSHD